jgi:hypothetical protein
MVYGKRSAESRFLTWLEQRLDHEIKHCLAQTKRRHAKRLSDAACEVVPPGAGVEPFRFSLWCSVGCNLRVSLGKRRPRPVDEAVIDCHRAVVSRDRTCVAAGPGSSIADLLCFCVRARFLLDFLTLNIAICLVQFS